MSDPVVPVDLSTVPQTMLDRALSTLLTLLSLIAVGFLAHNLYLSRSLSRTVGAIRYESPLEYGDRVNHDALQRALDDGGYSDRLNSHKYLLLYFMPSSDFQDLKTIKYGEPLLQRYADSGLQVFAVTNGQPDEILGMAKNESLTVPILFDKDGLLRFLLRVPDHYRHTYLMTSEGEIVFSIRGAPQEDTMRQIVEKYVSGKIDYDERTAEVYRVGDKLPAISVIQVSGGPTRELALKGMEVVFVSARCTSCQLNGYVERYRELATANRASSKKRILVFSKRFPQQELAEDLMRDGVALENIYIARQPLGDLDNEYRTKKGASIVLIGVNQEGGIEKVTPLDEPN
jgi:peroxiredoxin